MEASCGLAKTAPWTVPGHARAQSKALTTAGVDDDRQANSLMLEPGETADDDDDARSHTPLPQLGSLGAQLSEPLSCPQPAPPHCTVTSTALPEEAMGGQLPVQP